MQQENYLNIFIASLLFPSAINMQQAPDILFAGEDITTSQTTLLHMRVSLILLHSPLLELKFSMPSSTLKSGWDRGLAVWYRTSFDIS